MRRKSGSTARLSPTSSPAQTASLSLGLFPSHCDQALVHRGSHDCWEPYSTEHPEVTVVVTACCVNKTEVKRVRVKARNLGLRVLPLQRRRAGAILQH